MTKAEFMQAWMLARWQAAPMQSEETLIEARQLGLKEWSGTESYDDKASGPDD